jgi:hypothetical protein
MAEQNRIKELETQLETALHQTRLVNIRFDYERKWARKDELNQLVQRDDAQRQLEERYKALEVQLKEKSETRFARVTLKILIKINVNFVMNIIRLI